MSDAPPAWDPLQYSRFEAYQHARAATAKERSERRVSLREKLADAAAKLKRKGEGEATGEGDDGPGTP